MSDPAQDAARHARAGRRPLLWAALLAAVVGTTLTGCASTNDHHRSAASAVADTYGALPTFLPTSSDVPDSVLTGTVRRPALTTEGDSVDVRLARGSVRATVTGPVVPGEGLPEQTESTTCTWTVTLGRATTPTPIRLADFTTLDHLGTVYATHLAPGSATPPATLQPGRSVTFALRTVMPTGEGLMRWTAGGRRIVASWDFEVEND